MKLIKNKSVFYIQFWILLVKLNQDQKPAITKTKNDTSERASTLPEVGELTLNAFKSWIFPLKLTKGKLLKIWAPK